MTEAPMLQYLDHFKVFKVACDTLGVV